MKEEKWIEKYRQVPELAEISRDVLIGFNANIDVIYDLENLDLELDTKPEKKEKVTSLKGMKAVMKNCLEKGLNREVEIEDVEHNFEGGEERLGGQAGIMTNYLSGLDNGVIFYTPFLSEELAQKINENVLYPTYEDEFMLKNVRDAVNTDRTKKNLIFEYGGEKTGRIIFSSKMKGFGPYFRAGLEENLDTIQENIDRIILSGFHDVQGNKEARLKKSRNQIRKMEKPVHLEFVHRNEETTSLLAKHVIPEVDSIGLDEDEMKILIDLLDLETEHRDKLTLGEAFQASKQILEKFSLERCHIHTYRFHLTVTQTGYEVPAESVRDAMLFGELSAIKTCENGKMPSKEEIQELRMEDKHIHGTEQLQHFQDFFDLENFTETGIAELGDYQAIAIPTIIHEHPEHVVGMGDIISSGSFIAEIN